MDIEHLKSQFRNPPSKYAPAPFWFLNHELEEEELLWQIREMNRQGVKGFILHARHGLITEYLSDEWFDRILACIQEADKLGMKAYLYDENNWPSGPVDGALLAQHPEYRMSACLPTQVFQVPAGKRLRQKLKTLDGLIAIVAVPTEKGKLVGLPHSALLLDGFVQDSVLDWEAPENAARYTVYVYARHIYRGWTFFDGYLDTMNKDAVAEFIKMTHEEYTKRFKSYFGGTVDGIFTDEPMLFGFGVDKAVPYTPTLPSEFGWRHGYEFYRVLPALFSDAGPASAQMRCDYYDTITFLFQQAYFKQIYDYCEPLRLNFIGHVLYEGELLQSTRYLGDYFRSAEFMHWAGCDQLTESTWPSIGAYGLNNLVGPKLASSAAHIFQKPRVMSECFGVARGWGADLRMLKWLADWLVAMGVNVIEPHAFYYSIQGHRKWECPPGEFYQSAYWPYYKYFADYVSRLCSVFTGAQHVADVAVLYPVRSMWSALAPDGNEQTDRQVKSFELVTSALLKAGFDFDILPEEAIIWGCGPDLSHFSSGEHYKALIIPNVTTMLTDTADFIFDCIEIGTTVIVTGDLPTTLVSNSDRLWKDSDWSTEVMGDTLSREYDWSTGKLVRRAVSGESQNGVLIPDVLAHDEMELAQALATVLSAYAKPDVIVREQGSHKPFVPDIVHAHYRHGESDFYWFVNTSRERSFTVNVSLDAIGVPSIWNVETGEVYALRSYDYADERTTFTLDFQPCKSHLLGLTTLPIGDDVVEIEREPRFGKIIPLADEWQFETAKPNCLPITEWHFSMSDVKDGGLGRGSHVYTAEFKCSTDLTQARLLIDGLLNEKIWRRSVPIHVEVRLNDQLVTGFERGSYIDHQMMEADISGLIRHGINILRITCNTQLAPAGNLSDPAYIIGDFEVTGKPGNYELTPRRGIVRSGDWSEQGYPFYSGIASYKQTVKLPRTTKRVYLRLDAPGDLAEIRVNGKFAALLPWEPWAADITDLVKNGDNEIEICVANSMANVFMVGPKPSGLLGKVEIAIAK